ncbi:Oidioi.mRNA.OKI2018_I69.YSR.g17136.t1.cds [Oikopleura dioica]|uniref:Oidioi.mRNA.OKI2018_I69.YSR.g17136.t1.cds n=1 Tax=Oikopleura dioica TaxID=34765 RepID=A0ABN7SIA0_OIKDI|nr:Oidioi.mRNA.OKI2018_I69.YSR.g17136.t1.cds [Oikopleura dioica]
MKPILPSKRSHDGKVVHLDPIIASKVQAPRKAGEWQSKLLIKNSNPAVKINISKASKSAFVISDEALVPPPTRSEKFTSYRIEETPDIDSLALSSQNSNAQSGEEMIFEHESDKLSPGVEYLQQNFDHEPEIEFVDIPNEDDLNILYVSEDELDELPMVERPIQAVFDAECVERRNAVLRAIDDKVIFVGKSVRKAAK